ncbi:glutamine amidotransferase [Brooklawnia sp.]|uniref:glutamine amidotransferase n=1 Tax=Brooklawnia sp. TaxID=2699740 RepID=UPI00311EC6BE
MKPFLLISTRDNDQAARAEYTSVARHARLRHRELAQIRLETAPLTTFGLDLAAFSGIFLGGSSFNVSDTDKSPLQERVENDLNGLLDTIVTRDLPFLGLCYGIGTMTAYLSGHVDRTYGESVGAVNITVTPAGRNDPLLADLPARFEAFVGHKEGSNGVPPGAELLAIGEACPVQMYRVGTNVYVTQFHPELDADDLADRMRIYQHVGYFRPDELDELAAMAKASGVDGSQHRLLANFTRRYTVAD